MERALSHQRGFRRRLAAWALLGSIAVGLAGATGVQAGEGGEAAPDSERLRDRWEREVLKHRLGAQEATQRAVMEAERGQRFLEERRYERAREAFRQALVYDPNNAQAKQGMAELRNHIMATPDRAGRMEGLTEKATVEQKHQLMKAQALLAAIEEDVRKVEAPITSEVLEIQAGHIRRKLADLEETQKKIDAARLNLASLSATIDIRPYKEELSALQIKVRQLKPALQAQLSRINREDAAAEQERRLKEISELRERRRQQLIERSRAYLDRLEFGKAEPILRELLHMDPSDSEADMLLREVQRLQMNKRESHVEDLVRENRLINMQYIEKAAIANVSPEQRIRYPRNWEELTARREKRAQSQRQLDEGTQEILRKLEMPLTFEMQETPITELLNWLRDRTQTTIIYRLPDGMDGETISLRVREMRMENVLHWIMLKTGLAYEIRRGAIFITSPENLVGAMTTELYDVRDISSAITDAAPMPPEDDDDDFGEVEATDDTATLDEIISRVLAEDFQRDGAEVLLEGGMLTVRNNREVHDRVSELLGKLRAAQAIQVSISARFLQLRDDFWEEFSSNFYDFNNYFQEIPDITGLSNEPNEVDGDNSPYRYGVGRWGHDRTMDEIGRDTGIGAYPYFLGPTSVDVNGAATYNRLLNNGRNLAAAAGVDGDAQDGFWSPRQFDPGRTFNDLQGTLMNGLFTGLGTFFADGTALGLNPPRDAGLLFHVKQAGYLSSLQSQWFIRAVRSTQKADLLFTPHLVTYNNKYAWVRFKRHIPYVYTWRRAAAGEGLEPVRRWLHPGSSLEVRPTVSADKKYITVDIHPKVVRILPDEDNIAEDSMIERNELGAVIGIYTYQLPTVFFHDTRTYATVPDGGAILLTGVGANVNYRGERGVPVLKDLPVIGNAFHNRAYQKERRNYAVLVNAQMILLDEEEARQTRK